MLCIFYPYISLGFVLSEGSAGYTGYFTVAETRKSLAYLVGNYSDSLTLINNNTQHGVSYGKGDINILILGGVSSCPLCTMQVLAIAEKLASSSEDFQDENAQNFYKYTKIDLYPLLKKEYYELLLENFSIDNQYYDIMADKNCEISTSKCAIIYHQFFYTIENIQSYDIIFNIQGMKKNSIIYPTKYLAENKEIYKYFETFFKGFTLETSSDDDFISEVKTEKNFAIQIEIAPVKTKFIDDYPMTVYNSENFCNQLFTSCAAIPLVNIENIFYSIKKVSNNDYNITIPVNITNRYPFKLETEFIITILPTLDQQILEFQQSISSMTYTTTSQPNNKQKGIETTPSMYITLETHGVIITQSFSIPPYGKIDATFYLLQKPKTYPGGYFNYLIEMVSPKNQSNIIVLKNFTDNNKYILEEVIPTSSRNLSPHIIMSMMFILFIMIILAIVCCVMIKHKSGWLLD